MNASPETQSRTQTFARVLGPYAVIVAIAAALRVADVQAMVAELDGNTLWQFVAGVFALLTGLIIVALHQNWQGAAAVIISVLGWLAVLEGLSLLAFPQAYMAFATWLVEPVGWLRALLVAVGLLGVYLTYVGWGSPDRQRVHAPNVARADRSVAPTGRDS